MSTTRLYPAAALLRDGRVLVVGGASCGGCPDAALRSAEIYDTATGKWGGTGSTLEAFQSPTAALLPDGRVLVTGGNWGTWTRADYRTPAEIYDPATGAFTATATMVDVRDAYPLSGPYTSTLLADSRVLFTGGTYQADPAPQIGSGVGYRTSAEVYDPVTGTFSRTGSMKAGRESAQAVRLQDGRVLVMGGDQGEGGEAGDRVLLNSAEIYDPPTGKFTSTGSMHSGRSLFSATLLADGRVLVAGGLADRAPSMWDSAEIYDPATGKFTVTGSMSEPRLGHRATLLQDGRVLITGGSGGYSAELYDPARGAFSPTGPMLQGGTDGPAVRLNDGRVLIVDVPTQLYWP